MPDLFRALSPAEKNLFDDRYLAFLVERNGAPAGPTNPCPARDAFVRRLEGIARTRDGGGRPCDPAAKTWSRALLGTAAVIDLDGPRIGTHATPRDHRDYLVLERRSHRQILAAIPRVLGVECGPDSRQPRRIAGLRGGLALDRRWSETAGLAASCTEIAILEGLLARLPRAPGEDVARRALQTVLLDVLGHARLLQSRLPERALQLARQILPLMTRKAIQRVPELDVLELAPAILERASATRSRGRMRIGGGIDHPLDPRVCSKLPSLG